MAGTAINRCASELLSDSSAGSAKSVLVGMALNRPAIVRASLNVHPRVPVAGVPSVTPGVGQ
jgi:hypothetical protein